MAPSSSVFEYLEGMSSAALQRLYAQPATCLSVFRALPGLAQAFTMRLLCVKDGLPLAAIKAWCRPDAAPMADQALDRMRAMRVLVETGRTIALQTAFRRSLRAALTDGGDQSSFGHAFTGEDKDAPAADMTQVLEATARDKRESVLHYMVGIPAAVAPSSGVRSLLVRSGLMAEIGNDLLEITTEGFQFLMQDASSQIWTFLLQYVDMSKDLHMDRTEVMSFLFQLGNMTLGRAYDLSALTETQRIFIEDLVDFGLVYRSSKKSPCFYPTRLATTLISGIMAGQQSEQEGFIVVETNYRVYAYTDSPLQIAILNQFCILNYRFANMVAGVIRRESIRSALLKGITADQILAYLRAHCHPEMRKRTPWIPPTVADQIRLWQSERDRIKTSPGVLFAAFATLAAYESTRRYAQDLGVLLLSSDKNGDWKLVVAMEGFDQVKEFVKRQK